MSLQIINLECLLMPNNEIMFGGRSLGYFTDEDIEKYATPKEIVLLANSINFGKIKVNKFQEAKDDR